MLLLSYKGPGYCKSFVIAYSTVVLGMCIISPRWRSRGTGPVQQRLNLLTPPALPPRSPDAHSVRSLRA